MGKRVSKGLVCLRFTIICTLFTYVQWKDIKPEDQFKKIGEKE